MTNILIFGGGGMIGQKLAQRIIDTNSMLDAKMTLFDRASPPSGVVATTVTGDISDPAMAKTLAARRPDVILHLAAVVSGQAKAEFDLG